MRHPGTSSKRKMTRVQHGLLLALIRGESTGDAAASFGLTSVYASKILDHAKKAMECQTLYQLIALEVVYLMGDESAELVEPFIVERQQGQGSSGEEGEGGKALAVSC